MRRPEQAAAHGVDRLTLVWSRKTLATRRRNRAFVPSKTHGNALAEVFGVSRTAVDAVKVIEHSAFARLHGRAIATTRRNAIYLRRSGEEFFADAELVLHEYAHVLKQWNTGELTARRYVVEWLRVGYWESRYEIAAREFARAHAEALRGMLNTGDNP